MPPNLFNKTRSKRLTPTPLTPEKFFNACLLILNKEISNKENIAEKKDLIIIENALKEFKKKNDNSPATLDDWNNIEKFLRQCISDITGANKVCGERLQLLMPPALQRIKDQSLSVNYRPSSI